MRRKRKGGSVAKNKGHSDAVLAFFGKDSITPFCAWLWHLPERSIRRQEKLSYLHDPKAMVLQRLAQRDVLQRGVLEDREEHLGRGVLLEDAHEGGSAQIRHEVAEKSEINEGKKILAAQ